MQRQAHVELPRLAVLPEAVERTGLRIRDVEIARRRCGETARRVVCITRDAPRKADAPLIGGARAGIDADDVGGGSVRGAFVERERRRNREPVVLVVQDQREHVRRRVREVQPGHVPRILVQQRLRCGVVVRVKDRRGSARGRRSRIGRRLVAFRSAPGLGERVVRLDVLVIRVDGVLRDALEVVPLLDRVEVRVREHRR